MTTSVRGVRPIRRFSGETPTTASWGRLLVAVIALTWSATLVVNFRMAITVLMGIGFGAAVIGLRYPLLGLLGIGMLCTLNEIAAPLLLTGGVWRWNALNYWLLFVALLFLPRLLRLGQQPQNRVLGVFIVLLGLEILLSPDPRDGMQHVLAVVAVCGLLISFNRAALDGEAWYWLGVVCGTLAAGGSAAFLRFKSSEKDRAECSGDC